MTPDGLVRQRNLHRNETLKPCPFCGSGAVLLGGMGPPYTVEPDREVYWVQCSSQICGVGGASRYTRESALRIWNRREPVKE